MCLWQVCSVHTGRPDLRLEGPDGRPMTSLSSLMTRALRNIAIIAHVDHGKTTLVDQLLRQSGTFRENQHIAERVMDSNSIEKEHGVTILPKNCAVEYEGTHINTRDTPGPGDFGGDQSRVMSILWSVLLLIH